MDARVAGDFEPVSWDANITSLNADAVLKSAWVMISILGLKGRWIEG